MIMYTEYNYFISRKNFARPKSRFNLTLFSKQMAVCGKCNAKKTFRRNSALFVNTHETQQTDSELCVVVSRTKITCWSFVDMFVDISQT